MSHALRHPLRSRWAPIAALFLLSAQAGPTQAQGDADQAPGQLRPWPALPQPEAAPPFDLRAGTASPQGTLAKTSLGADQDTFVSEKNGGTNYGSGRVLYAGRPTDYGVAYGMVWFDLDDLPANQAVTRADVRLYSREAGPPGDASRDSAVHRIDWGRERDKITCKEAWDERDVTWNNKPDWKDSSEDSNGIGTERGTFGYELTSLTQRWRLPDWNRGSNCNGGLVIRVDEAGTGYRGFDSSEAGNEPELEMTHVTDTVPPTGSMKPLPPFVTVSNVKLPNGQIDPNQASLALEWDGLDPAPATGIDHFKLNGRANGGAWQVLADNLRTYGGDFVGQNGKRVEFFIQPVDPATNTVPPATPQTVTHFDFDAPQSTVTALPEYSPGAFDLKWSGVDLPNGTGQVGSGIATWTVHYNIGAGSWGLLAAGLPLEQTSIRFDKVQQGLLYQFRVMATDKAGHLEPEGAVEAQTIIDGLPPIITMWSGPTVGVTSFDVFWKSADPGGSGAVAYDVQFRAENGAWQDWVTGSTETSRRFQGELNQVYEFRARARDKAGNQGAYPELPLLAVTTITRDRLTHAVRLPFLGKP